MATGPRTPAEFRCMASQALKLAESLRSAGDLAALEAALDEVIETIERVYVGEQIEPTPCQRFMGRLFLDAIIEHFGLEEQ